MIWNIGAARADAVVPMTASDFSTMPATGAVMLTVDEFDEPSGGVRRASVWPDFTISPGSASTWVIW